MARPILSTKHFSQIRLHIRQDCRLDTGLLESGRHLDHSPVEIVPYREIHVFKRANVRLVINMSCKFPKADPILVGRKGAAIVRASRLRVEITETFRRQAGQCGKCFDGSLRRRWAQNRTIVENNSSNFVRSVFLS